jgi:hypothetical protein
MFIIRGTKGRSKILEYGRFKCPSCKIEATYYFLEMRKYFTFFWIPLFPINDGVNHIECQECSTPFNPSFFQKSVPETSNNQNE